MINEETPSSVSSSQPSGVTLTDKAVERLKALSGDQPSSQTVLRLRVTGGGCSGLQYNFVLESQSLGGDHLFTKDGATVAIDAISLPFVEGAEIDFVEDLIGASFVVRNPNATSSCGCGSSFSL